MVFRWVVLLIFFIILGFQYFLYRRHRQFWGHKSWFRSFAIVYWLLATPGLALLAGWVIFGRELFTWPVDGGILLPLYYLQTSWNYTHFVLWPFYFVSLFLIETILYLLRKLTVFKKKQKATTNPLNEASSLSRRDFLQNSLRIPLLTFLNATPTGLALFSFGGMFLGSREILVDKVQLSLKNLPENFRGLKIVQISDLHIGNLIHERYLKAVADIIRTLKADILVVTGDIIDNNNYFLPVAAQFFYSLKPLFAEGCFGVLGNHDLIMDGEEVAKVLNKAGLRMLRNETIVIKRGYQQINLVGLDFPPVRRASQSARLNFSKQYYRSAMATAHREAPVIVLNHHPSDFLYLKEERVDLVLSGHTHGGQFMFSQDRESPLALASNWYPYYIGHYQENGRQLYVNRGLGHWFPLRIACPPEITLIELV